MRVLVAVSLLAAYANAQSTCGAENVVCNNDKLRKDDTPCDPASSEDATACGETVCCTENPVPICTDIDGLGGGAFNCGAVGLTDGGSKANGDPCDATGCTKQECCNAGQLTCQDMDGYGGGVYDKCGTLDVLTANCDAAGCTNAVCCTQGTIKCTDIDGLNGGAFNCGAFAPMVDGGTKSNGDACEASGCSKEECCDAAAATCQNTSGMPDGVEYANCGTLDVKTATCPTGGCTNASCCTQGTIKCSDVDGLNGGAFDCSPFSPMVDGGTKSDGSACTASGCSKEECCSAGPKTCGKPTGMDTDTAFDGCGSLQAKPNDTLCEDAGCDVAACCVPGQLTCQDVDGLGGGAFTGCGDHDVLTADCEAGGCTNAVCCTKGEVKCADKDGVNGGAYECTPPMVLGGGSLADGAACAAEPCTDDECCSAGAPTCQNTTGMPNGVEFADCGDHAVLVADCAADGCTNAVCCTKGDVTCADKDGVNGGAYECTGENMVLGGGTLAEGAACEAEPCTDAECCSEAKPQDDDSQAGRVLPVVATALMGAMAIF